MKRFALFFLNSAFIFATDVDMNKNHQEGMTFSKSKKEETSNQVKSINKHDVPGYQTDHPQEMNLDQNALQDAARLKITTDEAAITIQKNKSNWNRKNPDIESEDLFLNADRSAKSYTKTMNEVEMIEHGSEHQGEDAVFECDESGHTFNTSCTKTRIVEVEIIPERKEVIRVEYLNRWFSNNSGKWRCRSKSCRINGCNGLCVKVPIYAVVQKREVKVKKEEWIDDCEHLEKLVADGFCTYGNKEVGPQQTRTIQGEPITRPSWFEKYTYICKRNPQNGCDALKAKKCQQVDSKCLEQINGMCVLWRMTYKCVSNITKKMHTYKVDGTHPFCFTGNCADTSYPVNSEIMDALSQMAILKEVQEDVRKQIGIFKGNGRHCTIDCANFQDCCKTNSGWGVSVGLTNCSENEKMLAQQRSYNLCVQVGTYCDSRFLGKCIRKKTGFCCFGSKLSKTIQEQGRQQLGIGWGTPENPDCRALTTDELSRLDFSKMDLTPLYDDINQKMKIPDKGHVAKGVELDRIRDNMKPLTDKQTRR